MNDPTPTLRPWGPALLTRIIVALLLILVLGYLGYLAMALGPGIANLRLASLVRGEERILEPATIRGPTLRSGDRLFVLTTQSESIVPLRIGITRRLGRPRQMLHVDLWAFDVATARPAWKARLRTFEDRGDLRHAILGLDGDTLWLFVREPIAVAIRDGAIVADGARLDAVPALAGKRVDQDGYVAFGAQGLQLTLSDATQWVVDGSLHAAPRADAPKKREGILVPAPSPASTDRFQVRGIPIQSRWLGVLTEQEAATLQAPAVVPGRDPGERRGAYADHLDEMNVPQRLVPQPQAYRLWSARVRQVSRAPKDWPKDFPDKWGTRDAFSDYQVLPEAPSFLQAGLLGDDRAEHAFWFRDPDSVLVLHHDKVGNAGRIRLARVAGPAGRVVWDTALALADLDAAFYGPAVVAFVGREPNPAYEPKVDTSPATLEKIVAVDVASGRVASYDLTEESVRTGGAE